jgi:hypothetical protein
MTVEFLDTVKAIVEEDPRGVLVAYRYKHVLTGKTLFSVEHAQTLGSTMASPYVRDPIVIYTKVGGWLECHNSADHSHSR